MAKLTLEERVASLEREVARLKQTNGSYPGPNDWQRTVGMFNNDPGMIQLFEDAMRIREADRKRARRQKSRSRRTRS
jgi:hypothetical protein